VTTSPREIRYLPRWSSGKQKKALRREAGRPEIDIKKMTHRFTDAP